MRVSEQDLIKLKNLSEESLYSDSTQATSSRASAYLAIETINQLKVNTRNNILFTLLGAVLGFIGSLSTNLINEEKKEKELLELSNQLLEIKKQLDTYQKYHSKKDSEKTFLLKN